MRDIIAKMNLLYDLDPDRRTVYKAIQLLVDMGREISKYEDEKGYYLMDRLLEPAEIRLLMDAVYSFRFISPKHAEHLINKLQQLLSVHDRKKYRHLTIPHPDQKSPNREVFYNIDVLDQAINKKIKIRFDYLKYDLTKSLVKRRNKQYMVNPYGMVFTNEHYYLVCALSHQSSISLYRIDRMKRVELTDYPLDAQSPGFDPNEQVLKSVYAFSGQPEHIVMVCQASVLDHIIDKFGTDLHIRNIAPERIEVQMLAPPYGVKFWALQFLPYVEVTSPTWLRQEIIESIQANPYLNTLT